MLPRILAALTMALALAAVLLVSSPAEARTPEQGYQSSAFTATNKARVSHDRAKVKVNGCVQRFAVRQAKRMAAQQEMFHQDLQPILTACGLSKVGENVAYGYSSGRGAVTKGWMRSKGHRANILDGDFALLGIGARRGADGTWYAAQVFGRR
ncbi:CAP domain-containing protein [Nocardioides psychrotolerans]|uniref:CAP domain-containing protein n=1 Tax=Nocardioides psychrotolerans TaxID=1005945 RepID=UPI003137EEBB